MDEMIGGRLCHLVENRTGGSGTRGPVLFWGIGAGQEQWDKIKGHLRRLAPGIPWTLLAYGAEDWNGEFSPWPAAEEGLSSGELSSFTGRGGETLRWLTSCALPWVQRECGVREPKDRLLGGYSLAGLFSLWAFYQSGQFAGAASCSGSLWYPGWHEYAKTHSAPSGGMVYLSLGRKEERVRNPLISRVGMETRTQAARCSQDSHLQACVLEWNPGGHFSEPELRMAKGFGWLLHQWERNRQTEKDPAESRASGNL